MNKTLDLPVDVANDFLDQLDNKYTIQRKEIPYGSSFSVQCGGNGSVVINKYNKVKNGKVKVVIQGKDEKIIRQLLQPVQKYNSERTELSVDNYNKIDTRIGIDESGKGDLFGPLVVGGVLMNFEQINKLEKMGVKDSKKLADSRIKYFYNEIKDFVTYDVIVINPERYNEMYDQMKNINRILAWGHARVAENLLERGDGSCELIVIDKFAKHDSRVSNVLMDKAKKCKIIQIHKGERDIAVATASIVARANFIEQVEKMGIMYDVGFPLGVSDKVKKVRQEYIEKYGEDKLAKVAKLHFKLK